MRLRATAPALLLLIPAACSDGSVVEPVAMVAGPVRGAPIDSAPAAAKEPELDQEPVGSSVEPEAETLAVAATNGDEVVASEPEDVAPEEEEAPPVAARHAPGHGASGEARILEGGLRLLTFEEFAFPDYQPPEMRAAEEELLALTDFPEKIQGLHGLEVAMDGYMVPVDFEDRRVKSFILSRYLPGCCFGVMPLMDEWVEVAVADEEGVEYHPFQIIRVKGRFEVGELVDDYGYVRSIYRLDAAGVEEQW
ncbi:MAG: DUF3299 domain-containing protein [Planctomycetota bacterium]|nr:DUF3299 domain-containing protein [Planctomycetota bacterium]